MKCMIERKCTTLKLYISSFFFFLHKRTHISGGTEVRTLVMTSDLTISTFC